MSYAGVTSVVRWRPPFPTAIRIAIVAVLGLSSLPALAGPVAAAESQITIATAINAILAGGSAAFEAPEGTRRRAFRYGFTGGLIASSPLWTAGLYARPGGPYLLRGLNAYGASVVANAASASNPLIASLRGLALPVGPGVLTLQDGVPRGFVIDGARLAALAGGFMAGQFDEQKTARLGVPVFRYGRGSIAELVDGEADHDSYGGFFNTIFLYEVEGVSQEGVLAHEFYHILQDDRALLYTHSSPRWKVDLFKLGSVFSLRLDGAYVATDAAALAISRMWQLHDHRPLEREAILFEEASGMRNALSFPSFP